MSSGGLNHRSEERRHTGNQLQAVRWAKQGIGRPLGMWHQTDYVPTLVADTGDTIDRSVDIRRLGDMSVRVRIAKNDPSFMFESCDCLVIGEVVALPVRDRHGQHLSVAQCPGPG